MKLILALCMIVVTVYGQSREDLAKQARQNMRGIEQALDSIREPQTDQKKAAEQVRQKADQVVRDIDELVKHFESQAGSSGNPSQSKESRQPSNSQRKHTVRRPEKERGKPKPPSPPSKVERRNDDMEKAWGRLPEELRQSLIDRNFKHMAPGYEQAVKDYFRRIFSGR